MSAVRHAFLAGAIALAACEKPQPPSITPKEVRVTTVSPAGLDVVVRVEATNPNGFTLSAQSVTAKAKLDGRWEMGTITIAKPVVLPPRTPTVLDVPMTLPWSDMTAIATLATVPRPVPYVIDGTVRIGGEKLNADVPFTIGGTITREQLANAAMKGLQGLPR